MRHFMLVCFLMALFYWSPGHGRPEVDIIRSHGAAESLPLSGRVMSSGRIPVAGAMVHLVPTSAITGSSITGRSVAEPPFPAAAFDEPLEDVVTQRGGELSSARTDQAGRFEIAHVPEGQFYVHVTPSAEDHQHLPGGDKSRVSLSAGQLRGAFIQIDISSRPSQSATYAGSTACLHCHSEYKDWRKTGHKLAWSIPGSPGRAQDFSRFPHWLDSLQAWIETENYTEGTRLEIGDYMPNKKGAVKFKVRQAGDERVPLEQVYADLYLWKDRAGQHYITIANRLNPTDDNSPVHLPVQLVYGGAVHRQRFIVSVPTDLGNRPGRYTLLQYNPDGRDNHLDITRRVWADYKLDYWWSAGPDGEHGTSDDTLKAPPINDNTIEAMCAGCHVTGVERYTDPATGQVLIRGVNDPNGAFNIDDDPQLDEINIGCETCHGPGSEHIDDVDTEGLRELAIVNPAYLSAERASVVCGRCHDRRQGVGKREIAYTQPINAYGEIMRPGGSRQTMITEYSTSAGPQPHKDLWGDDLHSKKPHQQYADFLKSKMYRNERQLVSCADCHDMHGRTSFRRWLMHDPDDPTSPLCQRCHEVEILSHMERQLNAKMKGLQTRCIDCHMPGTMISGGDAGAYGRLIRAPPYTDAAEEARSAYWEGNINSHVFDVPRKTNVGVRGVVPGQAMPIPYTNSCGACHIVDELPHK